jgi:hypothetical protein
MPDLPSRLKVFTVRVGEIAQPWATVSQETGRWMVVEIVVHSMYEGPRIS